MLILVSRRGDLSLWWAWGSGRGWSGVVRGGEERRWVEWRCDVVGCGGRILYIVC
jgi:hypothetical protein